MQLSLAYMRPRGSIPSCKSLLFRLYQSYWILPYIFLIPCKNVDFSSLNSVLLFTISLYILSTFTANNTAPCPPARSHSQHMEWEKRQLSPAPAYMHYFKIHQHSEDPQQFIIVSSKWLRFLLHRVNYFLHQNPIKVNVNRLVSRQ